MKIERVKVVVRGAVQGVGFRPFVFRLATSLGLNGWVLNSAQGVFIEVEGELPVLEQFLLRLASEKPSLAAIQSMDTSFLNATGFENFEIRQSAESGEKTAFIMADIATCLDCLREILDPHDRHLYPFTNCTNCGPRFTIIEALPYDRANTSMKTFKMCPRCESEYNNPLNRRFHAQPNACPDCGPQLQFWDKTGKVLAEQHDALLLAAKAVREGQIVAVKGIGGFQLLVDARNDDAVRRLRARKRHEEKPFAVMYSSLWHVRLDCHISAREEQLLKSPQSPIVLLQRKMMSARSASVAPSIAPGNPTLGVMLPCSPLHHLLLGELGFPIVATSGNLSDEPICFDEREALGRLHGIADLFLVHNRPIVRHMDDSVARVLLGREQILRRARGYSPLPIHVKEPLPAILAVGAHLKNTVALGRGNEVFISQHIGDLETEPAYAAFKQVANDLPALYEITPEFIACDLHPEYLSTKFASGLDAPVKPAQHHYAHVLSCMAENELDSPVLGVSWDGTGFGPDGTIWGGEFLLVDSQSFHRVAHLRPFRLPGGDAAIKEPRRSALGALFEIFGESLFSRRDIPTLLHFQDSELPLLQQMLVRGFKAPLTSSAGRLFDAAASLAGLRQRVSFEGQAAMELEFAISRGPGNIYPFELEHGDPIIVDWRPTLLALMENVRDRRPTGLIALKFHNTMAALILSVARKIGESNVVLTGGCFQNKYLTERTVFLLEADGFRPAWHQRVPPNDGGIALGQVMAATRACRNSMKFAEEMAA